MGIIQRASINNETAADFDPISELKGVTGVFLSDEINESMPGDNIAEVRYGKNDRGAIGQFPIGK